ncbi:MAG: SDR family NAD(P)-dependent oxidoreductase [Hyphomicrobiaceae bacterium]|nr:SDR family NAD(P)-dependent oxidoreductase [Hyphomicrobiaceae bacterium]
MSASSDHAPSNAGTRGAVVVTGASEGIGRAIAQRFIAHGHSALLVARNADRLEEALAGMPRREGARALTLPLDVTAAGAAEEIDRHLAAHGLHAEIFINNAGCGAGGPLIEQGEETVERIVALNVAALTRLTRHHARAMAKRGHGTIINIGSVGGYVPGPNQAVYYASKAYVQSLSEALASELASHGVHIAVVSPGPVRTGIHATMHATNAFYRLLMPSMSPERVAFSVYWAYRLRRRAVVPGVHYWLASWVLRVLPRALSVPLMGLLLKPR